MSETITMLQQSGFLSTPDLFLLQLIIKRNVQELNQIRRDLEAISILKLLDNIVKLTFSLYVFVDAHIL